MLNKRIYREHPKDALIVGCAWKDESLHVF